jgi:hypothetical protein
MRQTMNDARRRLATMTLVLAAAWLASDACQAGGPAYRGSGGYGPSPTAPGPDAVATTTAVSKAADTITAAATVAVMAAGTAVPTASATVTGSITT